MHRLWVYQAALPQRRVWLMIVFAISITGVGSAFPSASEEVSRPVDSISPRLFFLDIPKFDNDLNAVLSRKTEAVDVNFYDPVSPNNVPERTNG